MKLKLIPVLCFGMAILLNSMTVSEASELQIIRLPQPQILQGKTLMQALSERKTSREFATEDIPPQTLSNLLWAAFGINRPESGRRTAPSALNKQEIDIYVVTKAGIYRYDPKPNLLIPVATGDMRALSGVQGYVKDAPLNLVYVADFSKMGASQDSEKRFLSAADTGFISQNVYLYCASEGLATVVRAGIDRTKLGEAMKLGPDQKITLAQTVGYPLSKSPEHSLPKK